MGGRRFIVTLVVGAFPTATMGARSAGLPE